MNSHNRYQVLDSECYLESHVCTESEGSTGSIPKVARRDSKSVLNSSKGNNTNPDKEEKVLIRTAEGKIEKDINLIVCLHKPDSHEEIWTKALLDCGATGLFMDRKYAEENKFALRKLDFPIKVRNVDGTWNKGGEITHETDLILEYEYHKE